MTSFDFISAAEFRRTLERDSKEIQLAFDSGAWKSCQVLAGSIVETVLIDFLAATRPNVLASKDPLRLDMAEAIQMCRTEKVISDRTADLCSVVRSYGNLIHPARQVRLGEEYPTEDTARIAMSLVGLIVKEVAKPRRGTFGLTADQVLAKLENDHNAVALIPHMLSEIQDSERLRLLIDLLPKRFAELPLTDDDWPGSDSDVSRRLISGFRMILSTSSDAIKTSVAARFVALLRSDQGYEIDRYGENLFKIPDLQHVEAKSRPLVVEYYLSKLPPAHNRVSVGQMHSLAQYLTLSEVAKWLDPLSVRSSRVRSLTRTRSK